MAFERNPSLAGAIRRALDRRLAELRTATPARVERYDAAKQLVDAKPLIKDTVELEDGSAVKVSVPVVTNVPVVFPGAGAMRITFPVKVGQTVLLVFSDRSLDKWLDQGGEVDPVDLRTFHITDAIAIPGLHSNKEPHSGADPDVITIGSDSGTDDWVARASRVEAEISALRGTVDSLVDAFNAHGHAGNGASAPVTQVTGPAAVGSVGSQTVKVRG